MIGDGKINPILIGVYRAPPKKGFPIKGGMSKLGPQYKELIDPLAHIISGQIIATSRTDLGFQKVANRKGNGTPAIWS